MVTALAGALIALALVGGFLALDRTVLHLYYNDDAAAPTSPTSVRLTATEAEIYAVRHVRGRLAESDATGRLGATCDAKERIPAGWLVQCNLVNLESDRVLPTTIPYVVNDAGKVSEYP